MLMTAKNRLLQFPLVLLAFIACTGTSRATYRYRPDDQSIESATIEVHIESVKLAKNISMSIVGPNSYFTGRVTKSRGLKSPPHRVRVDFDWHTRLSPRISESFLLALNSRGEVYRIEPILPPTPT